MDIELPSDTLAGFVQVPGNPRDVSPCGAANCCVDTMRTLYLNVFEHARVHTL
jgi:hypothetical protein